MARESGLDLDAFLASPLEIRFADAVLEDLEKAAESALAEVPLEETERKQLVAARRGQGAFRSAVQQLGASCRVTGLDHPDLLIASHIKPWWACTTGDERLDGANGLMLAPHIDRLFDRGFISFADDGAILVSPHLTDAILQALGCPDLRERNVGPFAPAQCVYLAHHRGTFLAA